MLPFVILQKSETLFVAVVVVVVAAAAASCHLSMRRHKFEGVQ